jgi:hypothetical protein
VKRRGEIVTGRKSKGELIYQAIPFREWRKAGEKKGTFLTEPIHALFALLPSSFPSATR